MNNKVLSTILVALSSLTALIFVVLKNFDMAIIFLTLMFTFSNFFRSKTFKEQGYIKESKWMKNMSIFFGVCTVVLIILVVMK